ncbi:molybdenum ABC transporter ATP-binding protein [Falsirhodobacter deserti]|uniref:molybdenum ABC transporter ATP-binding protein n=1 Tax=Falsirhodobacter deserti TaxID=1365611 RepID=UPI000FE2CB81|nr:molybdenum ABC transporter ATP-binding protein [Falsirhodobacter deserti]
MTLDIAIRHRFADLKLEVAFTAANGVTALFGPSGAGKTTIANAVAGLLRPDAGRVAINGRILCGAGVWVPPHRRRLAYVFQEARLFPHLSVRANLLYGAKGAAALPHISDLLGIAHLLDRRPARLSGGERQRVALGRALLSKPELLIMDEPLAALDGPRKAEILPYLERLAAEAALPILYVSHSVAEVVRLADRVALITEGKLAGFGPPAELFASPELAQALGPRISGAVLEGRLAAHDPDGLARIETPAGQLFLPVDGAVGSSLRIRIMAEDVLLSRTVPQHLSALNILPARVLGMSGGGPMVSVRLSLQDGSLLLARITARSVSTLGLKAGTEVQAVIKSAALLDHS